MKNIPVSTSSLALLLSLIFFSHAEAANCKFGFDQASSKVSWTAFKTTQKTPVSGSFSDVTFSGEGKNEKSVQSLIEHMKAKISLKDVKASNSGNPARDQTLFDHFFSKFKKGEIEGSVKNVMGNDQSGDLDLELRLNDKTKTVKAHYTVEKDGKFEAKTEIDVLDFALNGALDDLHKTCESLHKGPDGVSKTWSTVEIKLNTTLSEKCE